MKLSLKLATIGIGLFAAPAMAQEIPIEDQSVRIAGFQALELTDIINTHQLVSEAVRIVDPAADVSYTTQFIMVNGWNSIDSMAGAKELCDDLCVQDDTQPIHLVSLTNIDGSTIVKTVFIDVSALAPSGNIAASFGFSGCVAAQLEAEAQWVRPVNTACLTRLAGGSFTDRRRISRAN